MKNLLLIDYIQKYYLAMAKNKLTSIQFEYQNKNFEIKQIDDENIKVYSKNNRITVPIEELKKMK